MNRAPVRLSPAAGIILRYAIPPALILLAGCASYAPHSVRIRSGLTEGKFDEAIRHVEKAESASSRLLTLYETGLILHYAERFDESNRQFHEAEALYEDLYTKSISREVGSLITSETVIDYRGERFEAAYIHYYKILNYLHLGDGEGALVECRKLNQKLKVFRDAGGTFYVDDPFLQYLTGIVYESEGEVSDAWVSYRLALAAFDDLGEDVAPPVPPSLRCDLADLASRLGYEDEIPDSETPDRCPEPEQDDGAVVLLLETGFVARKAQVQIVAPIFEGEIDDNVDRDKLALTLAERARRRRIEVRDVSYWLTIAFPEIVSEPAPFDEAEVVAVEVPASATRAAGVTNVDAMARKRFEERRVGILAKSFARALAKYIAKETMEDKQGELAGMLLNVFNVATETADTRSWSTLPGQIHLARLPLPEGSYTLQITLRDAAGERLQTIAIPRVEVEPGEVTFINHRVF